MKELVTIHSYLVDAEGIGDWEGEEEIAADNLNRLYHAVYDAADDDMEPASLESMLDAIWPYWQHNPELVELDDDMIAGFVESLFDHFANQSGQEEFNDY
ncbi:hypothetical protein SAMN04488540_11227 [Ferrimonas sediminum]|uniref:Uncharacterized protein n=1 Tax=Ferrimonas sediminum TaxID=718193 RepID=A0A1G8VYE8_9GAMM|nr:hypothetical protein [Ferrimonas sediminum]SDJ70857.1 hypothetical protein SAMN04488540_11227 [Ferrimonas sediminum]